MITGPLEVVSDYIADARTLLQDVIAPYRYDDDSLVTAFNLALLEGRRVRPDLFVVRHNDKVPFFQQNNGETVHIEPQFRVAFVYGLCGHALARDQEDVQDARATSFMNLQNTILTGLRPAPIQGGTPGGQPAPAQARP